ncbi:hypothetical protein N0V90_004140 [Kalmusia sp. IMI 367209]|nr:hypothetical protein N0V90_004140 [Kalmusia sp. IMI 367209]
MRFIYSLPIFVASALGLTNLTLTNRSGESHDFVVGDTEAWFDVSSTGLYTDIATASVKSDTSEVAACYVSSNSLSQSKWVLYDPIGAPTEFGGADVKFITCRENFGLPEWIGKDAIVSD